MLQFSVTEVKTALVSNIAIPLAFNSKTVSWQNTIGFIVSTIVMTEEHWPIFPLISLAKIIALIVPSVQSAESIFSHTESTVQFSIIEIKTAEVS